MRIAAFLFVALFVTPAFNHGIPQYTTQWSESVEVWYRQNIVVSYRAKLEGNMLVIEASHTSGWHSYAMDNIERARKKSGKTKPETEIPTRIELSGGLKIVNNWYQTEPIDLSQKEIEWYTWGFENVARFVVKVERVAGIEAIIKINGQVCDATTCTGIDDLTLSLSLSSTENFFSNPKKSSLDLSQFVEVRVKPKNKK